MENFRSLLTFEMEETGNEEIDDLITQAQDALFENDLNEVIKLSKAVLQVSPKENEAHELIVFALTQQQSTSRDATYFSKIIEACRDWNKHCGDKAKQLIAMIKVTFS